MIFHFAYGSNMSRAGMGARCPGATAAGVATLAGWHFFIGIDGYASIAPSAGGRVHGVLWRLTPRDVAALNAYENVAGGLYLRRIVPVEFRGRRQSALVYVARRKGKGVPRPGYLSVVLDAARNWQFPESYVHMLRSWAPSGLAGAWRKDTGEIR